MYSFKKINQTIKNDNSRQNTKNWDKENSSIHLNDEEKCPLYSSEPVKHAHNLSYYSCLLQKYSSLVLSGKPLQSDGVSCVFEKFHDNILKIVVCCLGRKSRNLGDDDNFIKSLYDSWFNALSSLKTKKKLSNADGKSINWKSLCTVFSFCCS